MTALEDLVTREASGVLGDRKPVRGCLLDGGRIAFARASWVPGLAARLRAISPALDGLGETSSGGDADDVDDAAVAGLAVQGGYLTAAALHGLIRSIVVDAFLVLAIPLATDSPVAAIRFTSHVLDGDVPAARHRPGTRGSDQEGRAAGGTRPAPTTAVALCDLRAPSAVLTREHGRSPAGSGHTRRRLTSPRGGARRLSTRLTALAASPGRACAHQSAPAGAGSRPHGGQRGAARLGCRPSRRPRSRRPRGACPGVTRRRIARRGPSAPGRRRRSTSCVRC